MNNNYNLTKAELINALIDHFGIREIIETYIEWLNMSTEELEYIYICETENIREEDLYCE